MNSYFYIDKTTKQQQGPLNPLDLQKQQIQPDTLVWCSGMAGWAEAKTVAELAFIFNATNITPPTVGVMANEASKPNPASYQQNSNAPLNYPQQQNQYNYNNRGFRGNGIDDLRPMPKNWLVESILATIFCCLPFGVAGIIQANKVEQLYYAGDYEGAEEASKNAKKWTLISFFIALGIGVIYLILMMVGVLASM